MRCLFGPADMACPSSSLWPCHFVAIPRRTLPQPSALPTTAPRCPPITGFRYDPSRSFLGAIAAAQGWRPFFFRTSDGTEIDLVLEKGRRRIAIECKASSSPQVGKGFWNALDLLHIKEAYVVAPVRDSYPLGKGVEVVNLGRLLEVIDRAR